MKNTDDKYLEPQTTTINVSETNKKPAEPKNIPRKLSPIKISPCEEPNTNIKSNNNTKIFQTPCKELDPGSRESAAKIKEETAPLARQISDYKIAKRRTLELISKGERPGSSSSVRSKNQQPIEPKVKIVTINVFFIL